MTDEFAQTGFVRQILADDPTPTMPEDVFQRLDAVVRAEAQRRANGETEAADEDARIAAARRTQTGSFGSNPVLNQNEIATKDSFNQVRKVLRRH